MADPIDEDWVDVKKSPLSIVVVGNAGTGKSTLISSLLRREVIHEGNYDERNVRQYKGSIDGRNVTFWDTPGLQDTALSAAENQEEVVRSFSSSFTQADVILYCMSMTTTRLSKETLDSMNLLTRVYGENLWKKVILVLTFANQVCLPPDHNSELTESGYFSRRISEWTSIIQQGLQRKVGVSQIVTEHIPVLPAGYKNGGLTAREDWITDILTHCDDRRDTDRTDQKDRTVVLNRDTVAKTIGMAVIGGGVGALISPFGVTIGVAAGIAVGASAGFFSAAVVNNQQRD